MMDSQGTRRTWLHCDKGHICDNAMVIISLSGSCVFETGVCGWKDESLGSYKWELGSAATPSANTGPSKDHTLNNAAGEIPEETSAVCLSVCVTLSVWLLVCLDVFLAQLSNTPQLIQSVHKADEA